MDDPAAKQLGLPLDVLQMALQAAGVGWWSWEHETNRVTASDTCLSLLGLTREAFDGTLDGALARVRPGYLTSLRAELSTVVERGASMRLELRVGHGASAVRWVQMVANPVAGRSEVVGTVVDIDERKGALAAALERERASRSLADNCPYVIARFDRELRHVFVNSAIEPVTGIPPEAFIGKTNRDLGMPEELCDAWDASFRRVFETGEPVTLDFEFPGVDGHRTFSNRAVLERDADGRPLGLLVIGHEVTALRRASEQLEQSESRLMRAQRAASVGTWDWDILTGEASWTDEAYRLYGRKRGTRVSYELWLGSVHPEDRSRAAADVEEAKASARRYHSEYRVLTEDGETRWVEVWGEVEKDEDRPVRMLGTVRDITQARQAEQELRAAARSRKQLLSFVSHDLRTPMQTLSMGVDALVSWTREGAPAEGRAMAETILKKMARQNAQMQNLVNELVEAASARENLPLGLRREEADLCAMAHQLVREHNARSMSRRLEVKAHVDELFGRFDVSKLRRIVNNLLSNALKYSDEGTPVRLEVEVVEEAGRRWAVLAVRDSGIGIPAGERDSVFDLYGRATNARDSSAPGSGIGLASVRELVDEHDGTIHLESEEGLGTTVTIRLPMDG